MSTTQILKDYKEYDSGENYNYWFDCNGCGNRVCVNPNILNPNTGKKRLLDAAYYPNVGMIPQTHKNCMRRGQGYYVKDGRVVKPVTIDVDSVDEKTKEFAVRMWRKEIGYQPLITWEKKQITLGRAEHQKLFINDAFYRSRHIESKI